MSGQAQMAEKPQDLLAELEKTTFDATERLAQASAIDFGAEIARIDESMSETVQITDKQQRDSRQAILEAELKELHGIVMKEEQDLAKAVFGLNALLTKIGHGYEELQQPSTEELALIKNAENRLESCKQELEMIRQSWWPFAKASRLRNAEAQIEAARHGIDAAKARAASMARTRLMTASMEDSLQEFMVKVQKTITIMQAREKDIAKQVEAVGNRKKEAFRIKEQAAERLKELHAELEQKEQELRAEEEQLVSLINGNPDFVAQEQKISELKRVVENIRGRHNTALVLYQSKTRFAIELEVHEAAQQKLQQNQQAWIMVLRSDTQERLTTIKSRLEAMKAMSDQDVAKNLDTLGVEADRRNTRFMAAVGNASDRERVRMVELHPERVRALAKLREAQAEAHAIIRDREGKIYKDFVNQWGIDPLDSSFFRYEGSAGATPADEPSPASTSPQDSDDLLASV